MSFFKKIFGKADKPEPKEFTEQDYELDYELKSKGLENVLGKMHHLVGHAIVPFAVGGAVDMYYFPNHLRYLNGKDIIHTVTWTGNQSYK